MEAWQNLKKNAKYCKHKW